MSDRLTLEDIDVDGAIRETHEEAMEAVNGNTRSEFLRRAGFAGGALMSGGAILGALAPSAMARGASHDRPPSSFGKGDIGILNYALTLEYLEASFYNEAAINEQKKAYFPSNSGQAHAFLRAVVDDENAHVRFLKKALGKHAVKKPKFNFHGTTSNFKKFIDTAFVLENTGVNAYGGQALNIASAANAAAALSIWAIEARHAAAIGLIRNGSAFGISPDNAFQGTLGAKEVLAAVKKTKFIVG